MPPARDAGGKRGIVECPDAVEGDDVSAGTAGPSVLAAGEAVAAEGVEESAACIGGVVHEVAEEVAQRDAGVRRSDAAGTVARLGIAVAAGRVRLGVGVIDEAEPDDGEQRQQGQHHDEDGPAAARLTSRR